MRTDTGRFGTLPRANPIKVVLAGSAPAELEPFAESLRDDGHIVRVAADHVAVAACVEERPALVVLDVPRQADAVHSMIHKLRDIAGPPFLLFLLVGGGVDDELLLRAYEAGIDGDLRRPFSFAYFCARVASAARLARKPDPGTVISPSKTQAGRSVAVATGPRTIAVAGLADRAATESESGLQAATASGTWRNAGESIRKTASGFLGLPVTLVPDTTAPAASLGCAISLTHAAQQLEIRLAVGADVRSARRLAVHMFGEEGDGLMGDMLNEVANLFMGTLKTSFSSEEIFFTAGLPETISGDYVARPPSTYKKQEAMALAIEDSRLTVYLGIRSKANQFLGASGLREGMVVAKDVFNLRGLMLVNGGTRLSLNMVEKLRHLLAPKQLIEVTAP